MDEFNEKDALWDLLGNAKQTKASPYFARKVLRAVKEEARQPRFDFSLLLRWLLPASAMAALAIIALTWNSTQLQQTQAQVEFDAAFDAAADVQSLVAVQETSAWFENHN